MLSLYKPNDNSDERYLTADCLAIPAIFKLTKGYPGTFKQLCREQKIAVHIM